MARHHDPATAPEAEGIPDLQDGTPEQQRAEDPQVMSVPGDAPTAVESFGTTAAEQQEGESLDDRLAQEEPDVGQEPPGNGYGDEDTGLALPPEGGPTPGLAEPAGGSAAGDPAPVGSGGTPNTTGSDEQQPEIAEGPVPGLQPGEEVARTGHRPPLEVDPPGGSALPRAASGDPEAVRRQKEQGGP
ncbi:hypothetical protein LO771_14930 [Streptacidiphilus sp. ASG 303]|uniref:hypothetical protein n=1 Tax=Streptacidiphilus sp. ASG 303 TaxID=2896847 RepID=UPI001E451A82|nr:hypothetical protein [Streptacidiphilus sp. ASG 303]MCD0483654.1 hypothetical protein [Streptacidiphilus sp. ASG 303]